MRELHRFASVIQGRLELLPYVESQPIDEQHTGPLWHSSQSSNVTAWERLVRHPRLK